MASKISKKSEAACINIQSYIRVRPLASHEKRSHTLEFGKREITMKSSTDLTKVAKVYTFDRVFGEESKQVAVYSTIVRPIIKDIIQGYNCTVFAYGQTGTGKTYTMSGHQGGVGTFGEEDGLHAGIIPRAVEDLFTELSGQTCEYQVSVSFIELYNEKLKSLLSDDTDAVNIQLIDDLEGGVILKGLTPTFVKSRQEVFQLLEKGAEKRQVAATMMNLNSSRSHTIFTISVNIKESGLDKEDILRVGKLHLVDLAGSENVSKSGANEKCNKLMGVNKRLTEASNINKSLLTLGRVITCITEHNPHIPYRESKLTRLLRDSLGGRTKTCIIGTISPSQANFEETDSTLNYAFKARSIKNKPEKNQTISKKEFMQVASEEILKLRRDLEAVRQGDGFFISKESHEEMTDHMTKLDVQVKEWYQRYNAVNTSYEQHKELFSLMKDDYEEKCAEYEELEKRFQHECDKFNKSVAETKKEIIIREYFINEFKKTEQNLTEQAKKYKSVFENVLEQNLSLHDKIKIKSENQNSNILALDDYKQVVAEKLRTLEEHVTEIYKKEDSCFSHATNHAGKLYDTILNHSSFLKTQLLDIKEATKNHLKELQAMEDQMVGVFQAHSVDSSTNIKICFLNSQRMLTKLMADMAEKAPLIGEQIHITRNKAKEIQKNLKNTIDGLREDVGGLKTLVKNITETILNTNQLIQATCDKAEESATKSAQASLEALKEFNKLEQQMSALKSMLQQSCLEAESADRDVKVVATKNSAAAVAVIQKVEDCSAIFLGPDSAIAKLCPALNVCQESISSKFLSGLQNINTETCSMTMYATEELENIQDTLKSGETQYKELQSNCNNSVTLIKEKTEENIKQMTTYTENVTDSMLSKRNEWEAELHQSINEGQLYMQQHRQELEHHKGVTNRTFQKVHDTVQQISYSVEIPRGTTPGRITKKDLDYPVHLVSTDPPEVLAQRFNSDTSFQANVKPMVWSDFLQDTAQEQSSTNSYDAAAHDLCAFPDSSSLSGKKLRRSLSMTDIHSASWTEGENKENKIIKRTIQKPKAKTPSATKTRTIQALCEINNS